MRENSPSNNQEISSPPSYNSQNSLPGYSSVYKSGNTPSSKNIRAQKSVMGINLKSSKGISLGGSRKKNIRKKRKTKKNLNDINF